MHQARSCLPIEANRDRWYPFQAGDAFAIARSGPVAVPVGASPVRSRPWSRVRGWIMLGCEVVCVRAVGVARELGAGVAHLGADPRADIPIARLIRRGQ